MLGALIISKLGNAFHIHVCTYIHILVVLILILDGEAGKHPDMS